MHTALEDVDHGELGLRVFRLEVNYAGQVGSQVEAGGAGNEVTYQVDGHAVVLVQLVLADAELGGDLAVVELELLGVGVAVVVVARAEPGAADSDDGFDLDALLFSELALDERELLGTDLADHH